MSRARRLAGDWQTPSDLANAICTMLRERGLSPSTIVEPTCGLGTFLEAAHRAWPSAALLGFEKEPDYAGKAAQSVPEATVEVTDAFRTDWSAVAQDLRGPVLFLGNPPWVSASSAGAVGSQTGVARTASTGLGAITGDADFDVAEWLLRRWIEALRGRGAHIAMLVKTHVARRLLETAAPGALELWRIDARRWFGVSVPAALVLIKPDEDAAACPVHDSLLAEPTEAWGLLDGKLVRDLPVALQTASLLQGGPRWRSGIKHDAGSVLELIHDGTSWINRRGDPVDVEPEALWPLRKSGDLHRDEAPRRALLLPQRTLAVAPSAHLASFPRALAYLEANRSVLDARRSRIYRGRPSFSVFGLGDYSFTPYKIAISGLHAALRFRLLEPEDGKPVLLDDTCYLLPANSREHARAQLEWLERPEVQAGLMSRVFPGAKRPVTARLLSTLSVPEPGPPQTQPV